MEAAVRTTTLRYDEVSVGDELPPLDVPITPTRIIAGAIASRDFQDVHHDRDLAIERGSKDIFMNILTTNGWVGRFVTDWAGPEVGDFNQEVYGGLLGLSAEEIAGLVSKGIV